MTVPEDFSASTNENSRANSVLSNPGNPVIKKPEPVSKGMLVAFGLFVLFAGFGFFSERNRQKVVVNPQEPARQEQGRGSLLEFYRDLRKNVEDKNEKAIQKFDEKITGILNEFAIELDSIKVGFSTDISTYRNCTYLIYLMAHDTVYGSIPSRAEEFVKAELAKRLGTRIGAYSKRMEDAADELMEELYHNAFHYAMKVSQSGPENQEQFKSLVIKNEENFKMAIKNLGFKAAILTPILGLDFYLVIKTKTMKPIRDMVTRIAARLFARPIAVACGSAVIAASDGPLPIGDIIALGGLLWTGYDIISARAQFENEISNSMQNLNQEMTRQMSDEIQRHSRELLGTFKKFCDEVETATIRKELNN